MTKRSWPILIGLYLVVFLAWRSDAVPGNLPTGNSLLDYWITVNNPFSITIVLQSTNATGGLNTCGIVKDGVYFSSYENFQSYVVENSTRLFDSLDVTKTSNIRFKVKTTYTGLDSKGIRTSCVGFTVDMNLGSVSNLTQRSFRITPTIPKIIVPATEVASAKVQIGDDPFVPMQLAGTNGIVWNSSLTTNNGRVRISLTGNDGKTVVYTQNGNPILPPIVRITQSGLFIKGSPGADTIVESTTDLVSWTIVNIIPWNSVTSEMIIPLGRDPPKEFFRARSN